MRWTRSPSWDNQDLLRRLCHALDIAGLAVKHLASAGFSETKEPSSKIRREKPIAETGVLLYAASLAKQHPEVSARIRRLASELAPYARGSRMRLGLALNPALAFDYAIAHVLLTRLGYPDPNFDALLRQSRAAQANAGRERMPHRELEQQWIASLWRQCGHRGDPGFARAARRSILNYPMDLFGASDEDLYAFTHAVMYITGFGLTAAIMPRSRAVILAEAEAALARCLDAQDYDLSAEILLAWPLTGKRWSPVAAFAFRVLTAVEDRAGFLPTSATRISELKAREGLDRKLYLLATSYHTAFVMGLLCAAALQPGCAPPAKIPAQQGLRRRSKHILPFLDDDNPAPHWRKIFDDLDEPQAEALAGMLFSIALQRNAARRDLVGLEQVLRRGYDLGLAHTPIASQAAEMLERTMACAKTVCAS